MKRKIAAIAMGMMIACAGLPKTSIILLEQLRTIDKSRIGDYVGKADENVMSEVDRALAVSVGIEHLIKSK